MPKRFNCRCAILVGLFIGSIGIVGCKQSDTQSANKQSATKPVATATSQDSSSVAPEAQPQIESIYAQEPTTALRQFHGRIEYRKRVLDAIENRKNGARFFKISRQVLGREPDLERTPDKAWQKLKADFDDLSKTLGDAAPLLNDPYFALIDGLLLEEFGDSFLASKRIQIAIQGLNSNSLPDASSLYAVVFAHRSLRRLRCHQVKENVPAVGLSEFKAALLALLDSDFKPSPEQHRYLFEDISCFLESCQREGKMEIADEFQTTCAQNVDMPKWLRYMTRGAYFALAGWETCYWRAGYFESTKPSDTENKFSRAKGYLTKAHDLNPFFPESAAYMTRVAQYKQANISFNDWFEKCTHAQIDYMWAYRFRLKMLRPQNGGSINKMLAFSREHSSDQEFKTARPLCLLICNTMIRNDIDPAVEGYKDFLEDEAVTKDIIVALDKFYDSDFEIVAGEKAIPKSYFLTTKAILAVQQQDHETAHEIFQELANDYNHQALEDMNMLGTTYDVFRCRSYALVNELAMEAEEVNALMVEPLAVRLENEKTIVDLTDQVLQESPNPIASLYFQTAKKHIRLEHSYNFGNEIKLNFDPHFLLWKSKDIRQIEFESATSALIDNRKGNHHFSLTSIVQMPGSKTIKFSVEAVSQPSPTKEHPVPIVTAGHLFEGERFVFGFADLENKIAGESIARIVFGNDERPSGLRHFEFAMQKPKNELRINICPQYVELFINDHFVFRTSNNLFKSESDFFEISQPSLETGRGIFRISDIRIKKWHGERPPFQHHPQLLTEHFNKQLETDPTDKWTTFWLAQSLHKGEHHKAAINKYLEAAAQGVPESTVGFFLGDAYEKIENVEKAMEWYRRGANENPLDSFKLYPRTKNAYSSPQHWASYRYAWNRTTSDIADERILDAKGHAVPLAAEHVSWLATLFHAQTAAIDGDFEKAGTLARSVLPHCDPKQEARVIGMIRQYSAGKVYVRSKDDLPIYRLVESPTQIFAQFENHLTFVEAQEYMKNSAWGLRSH